MHAYRTHNCGQLRETDVGNRVRLSGWVHRKRDHGGVLFVDLRDHYGLTQIVCRANSEPLAVLEHLRAESVVTIEGEVVSRGPGATNPNLPTGAIEIVADSVTVQSAAEELPLPVAGEADYPEDIRLRYRYLDLRRDRLHANILLRSQVIASIRRRMIDQGFTEFQTPILTASSPEGARDYLVPSRVHPGKFYALPQAPQMFKQLIMVAGFDRYFQIAPCFRDEDLRADRSLEFYQLDVEMSFVTQEDVFAAIEPVMHGVFEEFADGKRVTPYPFPRIPYRQCMSMYGTDKPDLRNPIIMQDVSNPFRGGGFGLFARILEDPKNAVWGIPAPKGGSRAFCDRMNGWAQGEGQPGLGYIFWSEDQGGWGGPIAKNLGPEQTEAVMSQLGMGQGDAAFFVAGDPRTFAKFAGSARTKVGTDLKLVDEDRFEFVWIVDFPMFEMNEETNHVDFSHNPFSMPQGELEALNSRDPLDILAKVRAARRHLPVDARLDLAREEGIADKVLALPRAVPIPAPPPHAVANQAHRAPRRVARGIEAHLAQQRQNVHRGVPAVVPRRAGPRPIGPLEGEQLRAHALGGHPRALSRDRLRWRADQVA